MLLEAKNVTAKKYHELLEFLKSDALKITIEWDPGFLQYQKDIISVVTTTEVSGKGDNLNVIVKIPETFSHPSSHRERPVPRRILDALLDHLSLFPKEEALPKRKP